MIIVNSSSLLKFILFADDTTVIFSHCDMKLLFDTLNNELPKYPLGLKVTDCP